jgi:hypothetical protein
VHMPRWGGFKVDFPRGLANVDYANGHLQKLIW